MIAIDCYILEPFIFLLGVNYRKEEKEFEIFLGIFSIVFSMGRQSKKG